MCLRGVWDVWMRNYDAERVQEAALCFFLPLYPVAC